MEEQLRFYVNAMPALEQLEVAYSNATGDKAAQGFGGKMCASVIGLQLLEVKNMERLESLTSLYQSHGLFLMKIQSKLLAC